MFRRMKNFLLSVAAASVALASGACRNGTSDDAAEASGPVGTIERQRGSDDEAAGAAQVTLARLHSLNLTASAGGRLAMKRGSDPRVRSFAEHLAFDHDADDRRLLALARENGLDLSLPHPGVQGAGGMTGSTGKRAEPGSERLAAGRTPGTMTGNDPGGGVGTEGAAWSRGRGRLEVADSAASRTQGPPALHQVALDHANASANLNRLRELSGPALDREFLLRTAADHADAAAAVRDTWRAAGADRALREYVSGTLAMLEAHEKEARRLLDSASERHDVRGSDAPRH